MDAREKDLLNNLKIHMINRNDKAAEQTYSDLRHYQKGTKMDAGIKKTWVEELRSGKYKQGVSSLTTINSYGGREYCCLGVLCDIAAKSGLDLRVDDVDGHHTAYDQSMYYLPESVVKWAGLSDARNEGDGYALDNERDGSNPYIPGRDTTLANLNDNGFTFAEIADVIEEAL